MGRIQLRAPIRKMQLSIVSLVLLSTLLGVFSEPQFEGYGPHMPSFRGYPAQAYRPQFQSPAPRLYFLESTTFTTTTSVITSNCAYSTAATNASSCAKIYLTTPAPSLLRSTTTSLRSPI